MEGEHIRIIWWDETGFHEREATPEERRMYLNPEPVPLGPRTCWRCHTRTVILWDSRTDRAYCPVCQFTQPPRRHPNTQLQRLAWTNLRATYVELEGVTIDDQRGAGGTDR